MADNTKLTLYLEKYNQEGDLNNTYSPLQNIIKEDGSITDFNISLASENLNIDLNNPASIECQPSYDGTVNLLINDDKNPPRVINTRFSKIENNRFKVINRNQIEQSNLYKENKIDLQTRLFKNIGKIPSIDLIRVDTTGQLKGGSYTFYIKYSDEDYNKTDIVAESGQVVIYKGSYDNISSISGSLLNELTDKSITLKIKNLDRSYSKFYIYFSRETSDTNGIRISSAGMFKEPFIIKNDEEDITLTGNEEVEDISIEELNIKYNLVTAAKTQTQVQNMLFLGNTQGVNLNIKDLQNASLFIKVELKSSQESIGWVNQNDYSLRDGDTSKSEYYNPLNIYYKLGYWPDEMYRLGIVYIMNDDSLSPVFNLRGHEFDTIDSNSESNLNGITNLYLDNEKTKFNYLERDSFLENGGWLDNTFGVFKNPKTNLINYTDYSIKPLFYKISFNNDVKGALEKLGVKGYFIVRQKRIATTLCQGLSIGVDNTSYIPMLYDNAKSKYFTEGFLSSEKRLTYSLSTRKLFTNKKQCSGLLSIDSSLIPTLRSTFDGSNFVLSQESNIGTLQEDSKQERHFIVNGSNNTSDNTTESHIVYVNSESPLKYVNGYSYSTKCGSAEDVSQFSYFNTRDTGENNNSLLRGVYTPFLGTSSSLNDNTIYSIKTPNYSSALLKSYFTIRGNDNSPFYAVSNRYLLSENSISVYRGDCFTSTVTIRLNRNFVDSEVPVNETIVDENTWADNYKGFHKMVNGVADGEELEEGKGDFTKINRADLNTVPLGMWVTYKCLSNYNIGLRSQDTMHTDEQALMGSARTFYPLANISTNVSYKIEESAIFNQGYGATVGQKRSFIAANTPYTKELFDNRIMFSNPQTYGDFQNSYRVFQGLDYQDIDRQYGAIVKLLPWNNNLLCIFEHGIGLLPVNEKALLSTQSGQSIHMYGAGVLQNQITLISPDYGSIWADSIIRTPIGVYGVDTYAKKIWRYSQSNGLETISDMKVQQYLNSNIQLSEEDKYPIIGLRNVKSHYNNYKGDIMFTFYNDKKDISWNLCFNERMGKWITRYSWIPLCSENIDNIFYSLDRDRTKLLGYIYDNKHCYYGIHTSSNQAILNSDSAFSTTVSLAEGTFADTFSVNIDSVETSYVDSGNNEYDIIIKDPKYFTQGSNCIFSANNHIITISKYSDLVNEFVTNGISAVSKKDGKEVTIKLDNVPVYFNIKVKVTLNETSTFAGIIGIVYNYKNIINGTDAEKNAIWNRLENIFLQNGFYLHGKAGSFNEISYTDENTTNEILPTYWYNRQEPFEFEFVVNDQIGLHKIFDNLVIISNNVQPNQLEFEIEGDVYNFNKAGIYRNDKWPEGNYLWDPKYNKPVTYKDPRTGTISSYQATQDFNNCSIRWDTTLNSYTIVANQNCKNISNATYGRRLGNIQYKEDSWYMNIEPITYKERFKKAGSEETFANSKTKEARIRDKFTKIRVKYTGEDLVIITALKTLYTMSYA